MEIETLNKDSDTNSCFLSFPGLWGVVNNAGWSTFGHVEWVPIHICRKGLEVNIWGTLRVIRAFLPLIRKSKGTYLIATMIHKLHYQRKNYIV